MLGGLDDRAAQRPDIERRREPLCVPGQRRRSRPQDTVAAAGLEVDDLLDWPGVPLMFSFADRNGNRFYVSETTAP